MVSSSGWAWTSSRRRSAVTPGHFSLPLAPPLSGSAEALPPGRTSWLTLPRPDRPWDVSQDAEGSAQLIIERGTAPGRGAIRRIAMSRIAMSWEGPAGLMTCGALPFWCLVRTTGPVSLGETDVLVAGVREAQGTVVRQGVLGGDDVRTLVQRDRVDLVPDQRVDLVRGLGRLVRVQLVRHLREEIVDLLRADPRVVLLDLVALRQLVDRLRRADRERRPDPREHGEVEVTGVHVGLEEVVGRDGLDLDVHADLLEHALDQLRLLGAGGHARGDHEADGQRLAVLGPGALTLAGPAGVVELLVRGVEVGLGEVTGVVLVALLVPHEDVVVQLLRVAAQRAHHRVGDGLPVDRLGDGLADVHVREHRRGAVERDVPEVGATGAADLDALGALGALQLVHVRTDVDEVDLTVGQRVDLGVEVDDPVD